jgi:hypothetical protein
MRLLVLLCLLTTVSCGDDQAPKILVASLPGEVTDGTGPFVVTAVVTDDRGVRDVNLLMTADLDQAYVHHRMRESGPAAYQTSIGPFSPGAVRYLIVEAVDADGNHAWYPDPLVSGETGCVVSRDLCWHVFLVLD